MTDVAEKPVEQAIPTHVDVTPEPGRRVRTQDGSLLPENHVLRGEARSPHWIRAQLDGDVKLTAHQPEAVGPAVAETVDLPAPTEPPAPVPAVIVSAEKPARPGKF